MTPRERVEAILLGREADYVPFTVYHGMLPQCATERRLRNDGLCIVRRVREFTLQTPDVKEVVHEYCDTHGETVRRTEVETPCGKLSQRVRVHAVGTAAGVTSWREEYLFKGPDDYRPLEFMVRNRRYTVDYAPLIQAMERDGGDTIFRSGVGYEPFQELLITLMGIETFSIEWTERRDEVLRLYDALREDRRKLYPLVAQSPCLHANYGGNIIPEVLGPDIFRDYVLPDYQEYAEVMHKQHRLAGTHLDANNKLLAPLVAESGLDYIEALTPPPDCDMSVKEAREAWPDKVIWINFPSSVHIQGPDEIRAATLEILEQARGGRGLIVGITDDVPENRWRESFSVILETLREHGRLN